MNIIVPIIGEDLIRGHITPRMMSKMVLLVEQAYVLARESTKHVTFLDWELGKLHEGYLRPLAVNYLFKKEVETGGLNFSINMETNRNKSHKFLLYGKGPIKMTISQVELSKNIARPAFFRKKLKEVNQVSFNHFGSYSIINEDNEYYLLLTYSRGGLKPTFVNLGFPGEDGWMCKINLMLEPRQINNEHEAVDKEEVISEETFFDFNKFVEEVEGSGTE